MAGRREARHRAARRVAGMAVLALLAGACGDIVRFDPGDPVDFVQQPQTSFLEAADGTTLAELHAEQDRRDVGLEDVADVLEEAVVAVEDRRFWTHHGVDGGAVVRAALANVEAGEITQGGSTITQQYVKNTITGPAVTVERKVREAVAAWQLEDRYSKAEILERYLNTVYFGKGAYGIRAASLRFFGIEPSELDLDQASLLAGLIASPSRYDPYENPELALERRVHVLDAMVDTGVAAPTAAEAAAAVPLELAPLVEDRYEAPYVVDEVLRLVREDPDGRLADVLGETADDRLTAVYTGGYRIVTTVDLDVQAAAEQAVADVLGDVEGPSAAVVVADPASGAIRALVGGRDYYAEDDASARFNLATQGLRQPGSSFKPIVLATALERGIPLDRVFPGGSCVRFDSMDPVWAPCNYGGASYAAMDLREATVRSVNTVYARLGVELGPTAVVETAHALGLPADLEQVPSIVLGTEEVTPLSMAGVYAAFANGGRNVSPFLVDRIETADGDVVYRNLNVDHQVLTPATAYLVTQTLQDVVTRGTGVRADIGRPQAGKTGTSEDNADAWFVGYTPDLVASVWVGFPEDRTPMRPPNTPETVEGGRWPAMIWAQMAADALADVPPTAFTVPAVDLVVVDVDTVRNCLPNPYTPPELIAPREFLRGSEPTDICTEPTGPAIVDIPSVIGLPLEVAQRLLVDQGLPVEVRPVAALRFPPGIVELQRPSPGESTRPEDGNTVILWVATASRNQIQVPDVVEVDVGVAIGILEASGWVASVVRACPDTGCTGDSQRIWGQDAAAGTMAPEHSLITVYVEPEGAPVTAPPPTTESPTAEPEPTPPPEEPAPSASPTEPTPTEPAPSESDGTA